MFETVLVANRGEIACRIIAALRELGIRSVAVYSDADAEARHVRLADTAVRIGPAPASESYLSIEKILDAARRTGAEAIHPGYGFLAENADFARACEAAGVVFIGPGVQALELMGDKIRAKARVAAHGVPVVPGIAQEGLTDAELAAGAREIGFPVLIKPSAGGGGKGMHIVADEAELGAALARARRESASAFGSAELLLERLITAPRHIEVQVLADNTGHTIHLGERECSLQRRHQKVIEEAPSPLLDERTRARIGQAAIDTARSVDYRGAGTVEFIVSAAEPDTFYFMEMNTRLQVEHPVTEMVSGVDLVQWQLRLAAGEELSLDQQDIHITGHAVEARVYAEDPAAGFLPTGGTVLHLAEPDGAGIRVDSALVDGLAITPEYDPMLAKVIAHGADRADALRRLDAALAGTAVLGVKTNIEFLRLLLADPDVRRGALDTGLLGRIAAGADFAAPDEHGLGAAALILRAGPEAGAGAGRWNRGDGWRLGEPAPSRIEFAGHAPIWLTGTPAGATLRLAGGEVPASAHVGAGEALVTIDGLTQHYRYAAGAETVHLWRAGIAWELSRRSASAKAQGAGPGDPELRSPMPGSVVSIEAGDGAAVEAGAPIAVVEAMKMEHVLRAPHAGVVTIHVRVGDHVRATEPLATITPEESGEDGRPL